MSDPLERLRAYAALLGNGDQFDNLRGVLVAEAANRIEGQDKAIADAIVMNDKILVRIDELEALVADVLDDPHANCTLGWGYNARMSLGREADDGE